MGKGTSTTSNTLQNQNVQYTPYGLPNFNDVYNRAQQVASTPYNPYTGELVAGLNGYQFGGINQVMDSAQQAQPYLNTAGSQLQNAAGMTQNAYNQAGAGAPWIQNYGLNNIGQGAGMIASAQDPLAQGQQQIQQGAGVIGGAQGYLPGAANAVNQGLNTIGQAPGYVGQGGNSINQGIGVAGSGIGNIGTGLGAMQQGFGTTGAASGLFGAGAGYAGMGANAVGNIGAGDISQYMNPFQSQVTQATLANMAEDNAQQQQQVQGNAAMRGALGGDRVGVAQSELARQQALANNQTLAGLNAQNYQQATQTALIQQQNQQANQARQLQAAGLMGSLGSQFGQLGATQAGIGQGIAGTANQYGQLGATIGGLGQSYAGLGGLLSNIGQANFGGANTLGGLGATQAGIGSQIAGAGNALVGSAGQQAGIGNLYAGTGLQFGNLAGQNASLAGQMGSLAGQYGGLGGQYGNLGLQAQGAGIQGGQALLGAGTASQQNQQALDTANYQQYLQQLAFPYQQAQFMAGIGLPASGAMGGYQTQIGATNQVLTPPGMSLPQGIIGGGALLGGLLGGGVNFTNPFGSTSPAPNAPEGGQKRGGRIGAFARGGDVDYDTIEGLSGKSWIPEIKDINIPAAFHPNMTMAPTSAIPQASNQSALGSAAGLAGLANAGKSLGSLFGSGAGISAADAASATGAVDASLGTMGSIEAGLLGTSAAAGLGAAADVGAAAGVAGEASGLAAADLAPLLLLKRGGYVGYDDGGGVAYPAEQVGGNNPYSLQNIRGGIPRMQGIQTPKPFMGEFMGMHPPMNIAKAASATPAITPEQMAKLGEMGSRMMTMETEASGGRIQKYPTGGAVGYMFDPTNRFPYPPPVPQTFPAPMDFSRPIVETNRPPPGVISGVTPDVSSLTLGNTIPGETTPGAGGDAGGLTGNGLGTAGDGSSLGAAITGGRGNAVEQAAQSVPDFNTSAPNVSVNPSNTPGRGVSVVGNPADENEGPDPGSSHNSALNDSISAALAAAINASGLPGPSPNDMVAQAFDALGDQNSPSPANPGPIDVFNSDPSGFFGAPNSGSLFGNMGFAAPGGLLAEPGTPSNSPAPSQASITNPGLPSDFYGGIFGPGHLGDPSNFGFGLFGGQLSDAVANSQAGLNVTGDLDQMGTVAAQNSPGLFTGNPAQNAPMGDLLDSLGLPSDFGSMQTSNASLNTAPDMTDPGFDTAGLNVGFDTSQTSNAALDAAISNEAGLNDSGSPAGDTSGAMGDTTGAGLGIGLGDAGIGGIDAGVGDGGGEGGGDGGSDGGGGDSGGGDGGGGGGDKRGGFIRGYDDGGEVYGSDATLLDDGTIIDSPYPKPGGSKKSDFLGPSPNDVVAQRWPDAPLGDSAPLPQPRPASANVAALPPGIEMQAGPYAAARQQAIDPGRASWSEIMNTRSPMYASATPQRQTPAQMFTSPRGLMEFGARVLAANPAHGWGSAIGQGALGTLGTFDKMSNEDLSARQKAQALAAKIKEHVDSYTQETAHQKRASDLTERRINQENMRPLGMTANNQPLLWDSKSGRIINGFTGQPPSAEDKMSSLGTRSGGTNPQMMRFQLAQQAYPDDPKKAAEVALGIRPPTDLQLDSYLVKNFPQLIGKSPQEIAAFREQFKLQSFPGAASGAKPMPTDKSQLEKDQVYQTPRGTARWDGEKFNPL